jgi:hypothetical protein
MDFTSDLKKLIGQEYIGLDAEWRPVFNYGQKEIPSIFQIATEKYAFIIDLKSFDDKPTLYKKLDSVLCEIFDDKRSLVIGFDFQNDLNALKSGYYQSKFIEVLKKNIYDM